MGSVSVPPLKRRKEQHSRVWGDNQHAIEAFSPDSGVHAVEFLMTMSSVDPAPTPLQSNYMAVNGLSHPFNAARKRSISSLDSNDDHFEKREQHELVSKDYIAVENLFDMGPHVSSKASRAMNFSMLNPFDEVSTPRHPRPRKTTAVTKGDVNGYVKFRLNKDNGVPVAPPYQHAFPRVQMQYIPGFEHVPMLPAGFGSSMELDELDCLLWKFYHTAFCAGRTLLTRTNLFLVDFAKMADSNACVRHAVLSLAATYVLDYTQKSQWRIRANFHYSEAIKHLNLALQDRNSLEIGKEDAVVAALIILTCEDIITWEMRRGKDQTQRWIEGQRTALEILDQSNPSYLFNDPGNVQNNATRTSNANLAASFEIVTRPVMPLDTNPVSKFKWLVNGSDNEQRRIHGGTGVSPKLLHIIAHITNFAAKITDDPISRIIPRAVSHIERQLEGFRQWSELSYGYETEQELLDACRLDEDGLVSTPAEVTDLTAQAWVSAAQIYLQCRFYRRPRSHPNVKAPLNTLLRCIERMPCTGSLFTSQSPFFPIFIMGTVSVTKEERDVARFWFETVVEGLGLGRSSVPPVWTALKELWNWIDLELIEDEVGFDGPIKDRTGWWEQMVERLMSTCGILSLC